MASYTGLGWKLCDDVIVFLGAGEGGEDVGQQEAGILGRLLVSGDFQRVRRSLRFSGGTGLWLGFLWASEDGPVCQCDEGSKVLYI